MDLPDVWTHPIRYPVLSYSISGYPLPLVIHKRIRRLRRLVLTAHAVSYTHLIMAMLPNEIVEEYKEYMESCLGEGCVYKMSIRPYGAICVSEYL